MKKIKDEILYCVTSGSPNEVKVSYMPCATLKQAREHKHQMIELSPFQGGGYHIVKRTTSYKVVK